jgi:Flp pilus assembly protein TadD
MPANAPPPPPLPPAAAEAGASAAVAQPSRLAGWAGAALIVLAALLSWSNSFKGPFVLDDLPAIADNPTIRRWDTALSPPNDGQTVTGRPLVNLSFALNHRLAAKGPPAPETPGLPGPDEVWGYHALNLAIHLGAALALFGLVRRALHGPVLGARFAAPAGPAWLGASAGDVLAFFIALLWTVHPLQTGAVTYIAQRAESLCALFYLLTLYGLARGSAAGGTARAWGWLAVGVLACLGGMASKEVMVSAPLLALLCDRAFFGGSFVAALQRRWAFYAGLAMTWGLLIALAWHAGKRGETAGFGLQDPSGVPITPWTYLLRQCEAIVQYLRLVVWPDPLVSDYGFDVTDKVEDVAWQLRFLVATFGATLWALWRLPGWGFLGLWFFAILGPSSSVIPVITETAAEHRMYLPLAALAAAAVLGAHALARRLGRGAVGALACAGLAAAVALGAVTWQRNTDYASAASLWRDAAAKRPQNARAHQELGLALAKEGRVEEAFAAYREALRLVPNYPTALNNYATALAEAGRHAEAAPLFAQALRIKPGLAEAWLGLGNAHANLGRFADAAIAYQQALQHKPNLPIAANNLGRVLEALGRNDEAHAVLQKLVAEHPGDALGRFTLANFLGTHGRIGEAVGHYRTLLELNPRDVGAAVNLGVALFLAGRKAEGIAQLEVVLRADPNNADVRQKLADMRASGP